MPQKLYTAQDMGGGLPVVNSPNPTNPQDVATKNYVDDYRLRLGAYGTLWETDYSMQCSAASFANGTIHMTTGPKDLTITKLYPDTAILVTGNMTFYMNAISAGIQLICTVNGGSMWDVCGLAPNTTGEHMAFPVGIRYYWGGAGQYLGTATGPMTVAWYMFAPSGTTVATDQNDAANWTIAECKYAPNHPTVP